MAFNFPANPALNDVYVLGDITYTFNGYGWTKGGSAVGTPAEFVLKAGDTMTGFLTLSGDSVQPLHAATKQYIDTKALPSVGLDGQALVAMTGVATWGAPVNGGGF